MKTMKTTTNIIVAFHIGRGGRFNNAGHREYIGEKSIGEFIDDLFTTYENLSLDKLSELSGNTELTDDDFSKITDLVTDEKFEELQELFGISREMLGDKIYITGAGREPVGLTEKEVEAGVGTIDIDGQYNTTYTKFIEDCTDEEIELMLANKDYKTGELETYIKENFAHLIDSNE